MREQPRVLLVQSNAAERLVQRALFEADGMSVREACTGAEALVQIGLEPPHLVILGRTLPDMDGLQLLPHLKCSELDFVPVLVASHRSATADRVHGLQLGADDYLARPFDSTELLARARALLRVKQTHDRIRELQQHLEQLVVSDPLTGLHNRRFLMDRLAQEMHRSDRHREPLAFAMVDLDGFKPINDQFGHVAGDKVLRAVGNALSRCVRISDVAARYGGDEFAIILPQTPPEGAMRVCERVLRAVGELVLEDQKRVITNVTVSLGLAHYPAEDLGTLEDLVAAADGALYGAKRAGKNRYSAVRGAKARLASA